MRHSLRNLLSGFAVLSLLLSCKGGDEGTLVLRSDDDLRGLTVACTNGNYYEHKYSAREDVTVFAANSEADALQAVRQGIADVFVSDEIMLSDADMKRLGVRKALRGEESFEVAFALRKGESVLMRQLNEFIAAAPIDGIVAHWVEGAPAVPDAIPAVPSDAAPLRCITGLNMEPVCYIGDGGQWKGMDIEILQRFAASIGRSLEITYQELGAAVIALQAGQADLVFGCLFATDERRQSVDFSDPYFRCHPAYFVLDKGAGSKPSLKERLRMNFATENRWKLVTDGLLETVKITIFSILLGTLLGAGICAAKRSRRRWIRGLAGLYDDFINGIPTLVLLLIMFYVVFAGSGLSGSLVAIVTFGLCFASSAGSIFDTAISSVPRGQTEAGLSLGFTPLRTFAGIVLPQAMKKGLPLYAGECVSLLKNTSIVGYIAVQDLTRASDLIRSRTFDALIPLLVVTVLYFVLAWLIQRLLTLFLRKK